MKEMTMKNQAKTMNEKNEQPINYPSKYNVVLWNNGEEPSGFVAYLLTEIFNYEEDEAFALMMKMYFEGKIIAGSYIKSIAETKMSLAKTLAEKLGQTIAEKLPSLAGIMNCSVAITIEKAEDETGGGN